MSFKPNSIEPHFFNEENERLKKNTKQLSASITNNSVKCNHQLVKNDSFMSPDMQPEIPKNGSEFVGPLPSMTQQINAITSKCFSLCNIPRTKLDPNNFCRNLSFLSDGIEEIIRNKDEIYLLEKNLRLQESQFLNCAIENLKNQNNTKTSIDELEKLQKIIESTVKEKEELDKLLISKGPELASFDAALKSGLRSSILKVRELKNHAVQIKHGDGNGAFDGNKDAAAETCQLDDKDKVQKLSRDCANYDKELENKSNELKRKDEELRKNKEEIDFLQNEIESVLKENCLMRETFVIVEQEDSQVRLENAILERKLQEAERRNVDLQTDNAETWEGLEKMQENIEQLRMENNENIFERALIDQLRNECDNSELSLKNLQEKYDKLRNDFNDLRISNSEVLKLNERLDKSRRIAEKSLSKLEHIVLDIDRQRKCAEFDKQYLHKQLKRSADTVECLQKANAAAEERPKELQCRLDRLQTRNFEIVARVDAKEKEIREVNSKINQLSHLFSLTHESSSENEFLNGSADVESFYSRGHHGGMRKRDLLSSLFSRKSIVKDYWTNIHQAVY